LLVLKYLFTCVQYILPVSVILAVCSKVLVNHTVKAVIDPLLKRTCGDDVPMSDDTISHFQVSL